MIRRLMSRSALVLVLLMPLALSGCEELLGLGMDIEGSYTLVEINSQPLPYTLAYVDADNKLITQSASATLSDGTYTSVARGVMYIDGSASSWTEHHTGTWEASGSSITFTQDNGRTASASFDSGTMVWDQDGNSLKFTQD